MDERPALSTAEISTAARSVMDNIERVIVGKDEAVRLTLIAVICRGHMLIEDVPGVGKTVLTKAVARSIGCTFKRIQFTPDLLPSDVTGVSVFNQKTGEFEFHPGPLMSQFVLADEINRATPKTQSALLEAMEEGQMTVDGATYRLPDPFIVMATQNPIEYEGTFPLPEAQLDRFMLNISLGYPSPADEVQILDRQQHTHPIDSLGQILSAENLLNMQQQVRDVRVSRELREYIVALTTATRQHQNVYLGVSPRGSLALFRTAQARALLDGRDYVIPDDIKRLIKATLSHRLIVAPAARVRGVSSAAVLDEITGMVPVPGGPWVSDGRQSNSR
ncbi:MAG TPA: MoxR family ATPase [Ktedonobacterales bacterium]|nr:MoxR family ATPase [Ktedonobacterales bacterium]